MIKHFKLIKEKSKHIKKPILVLVFLLILDASVSAISFTLTNVFRPDILAMAVYFSLYAYLWLTDRKKDVPYLLISSAVALIWTMFANEQYAYNQQMAHIFGLSAYPVFAWATGLAGLYLIYSDLEQIIMKNGGWIKRFFLFSILYLVVIITLETIAYHVFNIRNNAASAYPGLPVCECIHAPRWMQIAYFLIGPLYFLLVTYYNLKKNIWNIILKD